MALDTRTGGRDATTAVVCGRLALSIGDPRTPTPDGFAWRPLSEIARLESGHTPSRSHPEYWDGDIPWIGIPDASDHHGQVLNDTYQHVTAAGVANSSTRLLPAGTVCLSRTASIGYVVTMGRTMCTSQDFVNWVCGPELDHRYLHYLLMLEADSIRQSFAFGTTHRTVYYPDAKAFHVMVPALHQQQAIAEVLGALDDKITANSATAKAADLLVRARFEALPTGKTTRLATICANVREQSSPPLGMTYVGLEHVPRRHMWLSGHGDSSSVSSAKGHFRAGDVLFGKLRPYFHKVVSAPTDGVASTDILVLRPHRAELAGYSLAALSSDSVVAKCSAASAGTKMPRTSWADLASCEVPWPGEEEALKFSETVIAIRDCVESLLRESWTLAELRDALLPALMDGTIRVKDAIATAEGVL